MCFLIDGYVEKVIISFLDDYKNVRKNRQVLAYRELDNDDYKEIGLAFSEIAKKYNISIQTCCEEHNLVEYGFSKGDCLSHGDAFKLTGKTYKKGKNRNCGCVELVDIGVYNSCKHFCKYCYANYDERKVKENYLKHDVNSTLLVGKLEASDTIKVRH